MSSHIDSSCLARGAARPAFVRPTAFLTRALLTGVLLTGALLSGALFSLGTGLPAQAQTQTQQDEVQTFQAPAGEGQATPDAVSPPERFGDWMRRCTVDPPKDAAPPKAGEQEVCFLTQQLVDQENQRPVMKITIGFFQSERRPMAVIALPLGVPLAAGVQVGVDGKGIAGVPFQFCRRDGCQAYLPLSAEVLGAFKAGSQGIIQLHANEDQPINLDFSLSGFTAGYGSIE